MCSFQLSRLLSKTRDTVPRISSICSHELLWVCKRNIRYSLSEFTAAFGSFLNYEIWTCIRLGHFWTVTYILCMFPTQQVSPISKRYFLSSTVIKSFVSGLAVFNILCYDLLASTEISVTYLSQICLRPRAFLYLLGSWCPRQGAGVYGIRFQRDSTVSI